MASEITRMMLKRFLEIVKLLLQNGDGKAIVWRILEFQKKSSIDVNRNFLQRFVAFFPSYAFYNTYVLPNMVRYLMVILSIDRLEKNRQQKNSSNNSGLKSKQLLQPSLP